MASTVSNHFLWVRSATLCLSGGAAIAVLVSWGLAIWGPPMRVVGGRRMDPAWFAPVPGDWPERPNSSVRCSQFGRDQVYCDYQGIGTAEATGPRSYALAVTSTTLLGWPFRATSYTASQSLLTTQSAGMSIKNTPWSSATGLRVPEWVPVSKSRVRSFPRLPVRVLWGGLLLDAAFYGASFLAAGAGVRLVQRARRVRSGRCAACGYDISGSRERCPECGALPTAAA
jgi:hypothetical protein